MYLSHIQQGAAAMPKNKTLYVTDKDRPVWDEAKRMLAFYRDESLSSYITKQLRAYVAQEKAIQAKKKQ
jgi:hypothetical protein